MTKRWILFSSAVALAACGGTDDGGGDDSKVIVNFDENNGEDGGTNNGGANNGGENNGGGESTPKDGTNNAGGENNDVEPAGLPLLGDGTHSLDSVTLSVVASADAGLTIPRDLAFHPHRDELWIINLGDNSTIVFDDPLGSPQAQRYAGAGKDHFMARPSALAFGENGNFATTQEEDEKTQGELTPEDFMGPTLWSSDRAIYDGGHAGHLDMLHNSPNGAGIAWETDNVYWVFDGWHQSITRYDFNMDHGPGGSDHTDGDVARYVEGEVSYVGDVPSHIEFDPEERAVYIADTGNNRIARLDVDSGEVGQRIFPNYDGGAQYYMNGGVIETFADGADVMLERPSGLELHDGLVFVSDNQASRIVAIDAEGSLVDYLDLEGEVPSGGLMGMAFASDGSLFFVDAVSNRVLRVSAATGDDSQ